MTQREWHFSTTEFDVLWTRTKLDRLPFPLRWYSQSVTAAEMVTERARADTAVQKVMDSDLEDALSAFSAPVLRAHTLGSSSDGTQFGAHCAMGDEVAAMVVQTTRGKSDDGVRLSLMSVAHAASAMITALPANRPGSSPGATVPRREFDREDDSILAASTAPRPGRDRIAHIVSQPQEGRGEILVGTSHRVDGFVARAAGGLQWIDVIGDGRYLIDNVGDTVTAEPATTAALVTQLRAALLTPATTRSSTVTSGLSGVVG